MAEKRTLGVLHRPVNPSPAAFITTADEAGRGNIVTLAEVFNVSISEPVIVGIAIRPDRYSHTLMQQSSELVINLTTVEIVEQVDRCGSRSGSDGFDKFSAFGLTPLPGSLVKAPLIAECPVNIECRVLSIQSVGDHDLVLGQVLTVHADEDKLNERGRLDTAKLNLLVYADGGYWALGQQVGRHGFTGK